jgi:hypothetical protein
MGTSLSVEPAASMFRVEMADSIHSVWQEDHSLDLDSRAGHYVALYYR